MRNRRFSCRLAVLLFVLFVPVGVANASAQIMLSGGITPISMNGDIRQIHLPVPYGEVAVRGVFDKGENIVSPFFKVAGVLANLDTTSHTSKTMMYGLIPSVGVNVDFWIFNVYAMAGFGPYTYGINSADEFGLSNFDRVMSGMLDFAVGVDMHVLGSFFLNVTNHIDYLLGFRYLQYRLTAGVGISFGRHVPVPVPRW